MKIPFSRYLCFWILLIMSVPQLSALTLGGSDLLAGPIEEALKLELAGMNEEVRIDLQGSLLGRKVLEAGELDACILAIPDGDDAPAEYRRFPVAFQIVAFGVHESHPVREVSYGQLVRLFGDEDVIENWSGLTDALTWADRKILLRAPRSDTLVCLELFNAEVLHGKPYREELKVVDAVPEAMVEMSRMDTAAIMMVPYIQDPAPIRLLDVKAGDDDQAYNPSPVNVFYGDYPLRLPFYLVVRDSLAPETARAILEAVFSSSVTEALSKSHFVPLPDQERRELLSRFE